MISLVPDLWLIKFRDVGRAVWIVVICENRLGDVSGILVMLQHEP